MAIFGMIFISNDMSYINLKGRLLDMSAPMVMGILNVTPDSFFEGSRSNGSDMILSRARSMIDAGVDIIDIGGYSSRPGADEVSEDEEAERVATALRVIRSEDNDIILSVDTFRSSVAMMAVNDYGVDIINDISGGAADVRMMETVARLKVPYIMMHMQGTPATMQDNPHYDDVVGEIILWFSERINRFRMAGINDIIVDPGFGFGKTTDHNYKLLNSLDRFSILGCPLLAGLSRKTMIWKVLGVTPDSSESLHGTIALNSVALLKGASIIRVHDVAEAVCTVKLLERVRGIG